MLNRSFFSLLTVVSCLSIYSLADGKDFKVLYLSSPDAILIDGNTIHVNDIISDGASLIWKDENQVLKVSDVETHKQYIICARSVTNKKVFSLSDYFFLTKPLASRSGVINTLQDLSSLFQGRVIIDKHLVLATSILQDETHFFYLTCNFSGNLVNKAIAPINGFLLLCSESIFKVDGMPIDPVATEAALYYYDSNTETSICVNSGFFIVPVL